MPLNPWPLIQREAYLQQTIIPAELRGVSRAQLDDLMALVVEAGPSEPVGFRVLGFGLTTIITPVAVFFVQSMSFRCAMAWE